MLSSVLCIVPMTQMTKSGRRIASVRIDRVFLRKRL
jgi:hypothetical protein